MIESLPRVTVGIPTFNRERLLGRTVQSVLSQDYSNIEIVISDNASTDATGAVCLCLATEHPNIVYFRQLENIGATRNFTAVLERASGHFFMWLGDDDYIDSNYVSTAVAMLELNPAVELVSGEVSYYRDGACIAVGRRFNLLSTVWWCRMAKYYWRVSDNGLFYGLMRTSTIERVPLKNVLGGDWLAMARLAATGKIMMVRGTSVHRELGGTSSTHANIAKSLGIPAIQAHFPHISIACNALRDVTSGGFPLANYGSTKLRLSGALIFFVLLTRGVTTAAMRAAVVVRKALRQIKSAF